MNFDNFTFRCSSLGYIMTDPKEKSNLVKYNDALISMQDKTDKLANCSEKAVKISEKLVDDIEVLSTKISQLELIKDVPNLSESCKTHLCDIYTRVKYNRTEDIKSKYLEKGLLLEEDAITQYCLLTGEFHKKNKVRENNGFIEGELDFVDPTFVHDTKVNWSIFQFNRTVARPIKPLYKWQIKGYMWLWKRKYGKLIYILLDTPEHMIVAEEKRLMYDLFGSEANYISAPEHLKDQYSDACKEIRRNHIYTDIPIEEKVRVFDIDSEEDDAEKITKRVIECRAFLNAIDKHETLLTD